MLVTADQPEAPAAFRVDLGAIFVSLELSKSTWVITSLSPGACAKLSRHTVAGGDIAGLLARFGELRAKAQARSGNRYPLVVIHEAGLDGFWIDRRLHQEDWIESHVVDAASISVSRRRRRVKTDKIDGETMVRTLLAYKRGEPRVCSMVKVPAAEEEDRRRICRERKALVGERTLHINRTKGLLFSQGITSYEPLRRDRRVRLEELRSGDDRALPDHPKAHICRELDRLELLLEQIKTVEAERDALLTEKREDVPSSAAMLPPPSSTRKVCTETSTIGGSLQPMRGWRRRLGEAGRSTVNRASRKQAIRACERRWSSCRGRGCAISRTRR